MLLPDLGVDLQAHKRQVHTGSELWATVLNGAAGQIRVRRNMQRDGNSTLDRFSCRAATSAQLQYRSAG